MSDNQIYFDIKKRLLLEIADDTNISRYLINIATFYNEKVRQTLKKEQV